MEKDFIINKSLTYANIISSVVRSVNCKLYLELGVLQGHNIKEVSKNCKHCIGVDMDDILEFRDFEFHLKSTDEFFKVFNGKPDVIFIDADHQFEQVKKDFINSLNCLNEGSVIFLHDTDPISKELTEQRFCGNSYKIHEWIKENYSNLNIVTLPIDVAGLSIVNRENDRRILKI